MKQKLKYLKLMVALILLYLTATVVIPFVNTLAFFNPIQEVVRKWDINTSAFFYTDDISSNPEIRKFTDK